MDFSWTPQQQELYDSAKRFCVERLNPTLAGKPVGRDAWTLCGEFGLLGLCVPRQYGGLGLDAQTSARVIEAFGRYADDQGLVFGASAHLFACAMAIAQGSEELKQQLLPDLASGRCLGANAISEPDAGSDVFALRTAIRRDGDSYVVDGVKSWVSNGALADWFVVYGTLDPRKGPLGIVALAVHRSTPGLTIGEPIEKIGLQSCSLTTLYLDNCRVPIAHGIGREGRGARVFHDSMRWERSCLFAAYLGSMERQLEKAIAYARERKQGGQSIGKYQSISHRIADMKLSLETSRLMLYRACWLLDQGQATDMDIALAKLVVSEAAVQNGLSAIAIHGGLGVVTDGGVEVALRDAIPSMVFSGTSEIQRNLIARELGL